MVLQSNEPHNDRLLGARLTLMELLAIAQDFDIIRLISFSTRLCLWTEEAVAITV
ncbi:MAG: hypothetical protein RIE73_30030 [Coleofasciculus sp. C1-SOL-03]|uniref:hypothetical protein n=1 Tax=Coleofasciculus sp. C1-SOL-03 TaxID=3069522 RepID=UPI0032F8D143